MTSATSFFSATLAACAACGAHASYYWVYDPGEWAAQAGGTPVHADLFSYLGNPFTTQQIPDTIFADLGVTLHSAVPLVAYMETYGGWFITTEAEYQQLEIRFSTPQTAVFVKSRAVNTWGHTTYGATSTAFYSGSELVAATAAHINGLISSTPIDRIVIATIPWSDGHRPSFGPTFMFVPSPAGSGLLLVALIGPRARRRH